MRPFLLSLLLLVITCRSGAAVINVTSTQDSGSGSLRAAIATALSQAGADEIRFIAALNGQTITLMSGELATGAQQVTVNSTGLANGITLSGNNASRIFSVPAGGTLELRGLTLTHGGNVDGAAVKNAGTLLALNCTLSGNGGAADGGAVWSSGTFTASQCTFTANGAANGGAVFNTGSLTLLQCTLTRNAAGTGGGVNNQSLMSLTNTILSDNLASLAGDVFNVGTVTLSGANLLLDLVNQSPGSTSGPAAIPALPRVQPLANYGGPTPTMPPRADSVALDRIAATSFTTDQRGLPRVMWGTADIGAVEAGTQADCAWEVREFYHTPATPLNSLADALALTANVSASMAVSAPPVINHADPDNPGIGGYFPDDEPVGVNNQTFQGAINGDDNDFATVARTFITITVEDDYTFGFSSNEGGRLRVYGATFISSTRLNAANPANPAHSGDTLSFAGLTDNSATLGVCHLTAGVYPVEFLTWERTGGAYSEVFAARGVHTSVDAAFRLLGDISPGGAFGAGSLTALPLPGTWAQEFEDDDGGFTVSNPNGAFEGPWKRDTVNGTWGTAGQGAEVGTSPSTLLASPVITMHCNGDATLRFTHRFSFENGNWDGGQVRLSVNGGPFNPVTPVAFTQNGYTGTVALNSAAALHGQAAFVFDSTGYVVPVFISSTARLGTFNAGDALRVQFMASFDNDTIRGNPAWELDTVSVEQTCAGAPPGWEVTTIRNGADSMSTALTQLYAQWSGVPQPNTVSTLASTLNLVDPQAPGGGHGQTQAPFPRDGEGDDDQFALGARATLNVPAADDYTFCLLADDAARLRIKGSSQWTVFGGFAPLTLVDGFQADSSGDVFGQVRLTAGAHDVELIYYEGFGSAYLSLWVARGRYTSFNPEVFSLVGGPGMIRASTPFGLARQPGLSRPTNDDWSASAVLTGKSVVCTAGATKESGEPGGPATGATVWWKWTPPSPGTYVFDTSGSDFDTVLSVYSGPNIANLSLVAADDNYGSSSAARVTMTTAPNYSYIQVGGVNGATGRLVLSVTRASAPANDSFSAARALGSPYSISAISDNDAATAEAGEPAPVTGNAARGSVWFTWTAPASGEYRVDTIGSRFDTLLAVYTGSALTSLVRVGSSDNISPQEKQSAVSFTAVAGTLYHIAVDAHDVAARGDLRLNITHLAVVTSYALLPGSLRTFSMTWRSEPWTTYRVERSADMNSWLTVTDCLPSGGAATSFDAGGLSTGTPRQYFRVRRE